MSFLGGVFGGKQNAQQITTTLDLVTHAASLVSNPGNIDPLLDKVRGITANLEPGKPLTPANDQALVAIYLQLEGYLVNREPIRSFSREKLRARLASHILDLVIAHEQRNTNDMAPPAA